MHLKRPSDAGSNQAASWAPKWSVTSGKNDPAPGARANRNNRPPKSSIHRHGCASRHEHREWGDQPREVKPEKIAPHLDALTKFLSNEESSQRNMFESEFEDKILQVIPETLPERLSRSEKIPECSFVPKASHESASEVLVILTYAPQVQFITATVKKAKSLPFNNNPFARVMLFERRHLIEQKQTTVTPTLLCNSCITQTQQSETSDSPSTSNVSETHHQTSIPVRRSCDTTFSESFLFHVTPQMLDRCHVVIEMFDVSSSGSDRTPFSVGYCVIGPMCSGAGSAHWIQMIRKSGMPVCMWHPLRPV